MKKMNILVPDLPESVSDATVVKWHKRIGDSISYDDNIVDIETDKVMLEVSSPCDGILQSILEKEGATVKSQQIIGEINKLNIIKNDLSDNLIQNPTKEKFQKEESFLTKKREDVNFTPSIRRLIKIYNIDKNLLNQSIQKINDLNHKNITHSISKKINCSLLQNNFFNSHNTSKKENYNFKNRVKMTRLRQRIAERLLESKNNTAMLTTFHEVNMKPIILLREKYGEHFKKLHGIRLGFMSFFVKAVVESLKKFPEINASIDGTDIIYYKNFDISIAISTDRGLITPVLKNVDNMSMSEIEKKIKEFSIKSSENKIHIKDLTGGNFTITNGGIFGSLMSTPIINPPQTAILGMHTIQERTIVVNGKIKILPMMYLALSYDHRLIDGKESVGFLISVKNILEDFTRILIEI